MADRYRRVSTSSDQETPIRCPECAATLVDDLWWCPQCYADLRAAGADEDTVEIPLQRRFARGKKREPKHRAAPRTGRDAAAMDAAEMEEAAASMLAELAAEEPVSLLHRKRSGREQVVLGTVVGAVLFALVLGVMTVVGLLT